MVGIFIETPKTAISAKGLDELMQSLGMVFYGVRDINKTNFFISP